MRLVVCVLVVTSAVVSFVIQPVEGGILHRYSFSGDASDSVGTADGTIVDAGSSSNHQFNSSGPFVGTRLELQNTGQLSNAITEDAYVDLPNGLLSNAATVGTNGAVTFELWASISQADTWQRWLDFGTSDDGEDTSNGGNTSPYVIITPNSDVFNDGLSASNHPGTGPEPSVGVDGSIDPTPLNDDTHVVVVFDHNDTSEGSNGTMKLYRDGTLVGSTEIDADLDLTGASVTTGLTDNNNWLGRSQYADPTLRGSFNEFRVFDMPVNAAYVSASYNAGPDNLVPVPEPSTAALALLGALGLFGAVAKRKRN